ncbi:MAG: ATP synthase subunit I [Gammaproteobacteria bacterium]|nr:ATP synthase subunit I [Gammaproteobacteria bacterium]
MRLIFISQILAACVVTLVMALLSTQADAIAVAYGALLGLTITLITRRSTDRALQAAVENPTHGIVAMFSGFALRYAVVILGLLAGFRVLHLSAEPMIAGFILIIVIQVLVATLLRPQTEKREA